MQRISTRDRVNTLDSTEKEAKTRYGILNVERRKYPRFSVDLPIEYYRIGSTSSLAGRTRNLGEGGLLIDFPEQMEIGQRLKLRLFLSMDSKMNTIELLVDVVWVDIHIDEGWGDYRSGVKFVDISQDDVTKLKVFLNSLSQPPYTR
jgi:c-di-GMP-binding flagellar brake protein YcgR